MIWRDAPSEKITLCLLRRDGMEDDTNFLVNGPFGKNSVTCGGNHHGAYFGEILG
jgi:hypothetical protein